MSIGISKNFLSPSFPIPSFSVPAGWLRICTIKCRSKLTAKHPAETWKKYVPNQEIGNECKVLSPQCNFVIPSFPIPGLGRNSVPSQQSRWLYKNIAVFAESPADYFFEVRAYWMQGLSRNVKECLWKQRISLKVSKIQSLLSLITLLPKLRPGKEMYL